jgi:patatin-like phospholipase/acyl hydrolase
MARQQPDCEETMPRFQILSIDGGGIKGLFSASLLAHLEEDLRTDITRHFDLIVGTSTGGIIALGLGLGIRPAEIIEFYVRQGCKIFPPVPRPFDWRRLKHWVRHKYDSAPLERALRERFGEKRLGESKKRLVIPAFNLADNDVKLFKTAHHPKLRRDYKLLAWKVAMATSAAPTFFPDFNQVDHQRLIDGGVWANNPIMVAVTEALGVLDIRLPQISILSVGTLEELPRRPQRLHHGGKLQWAGQAVEVLFAGQSLGAVKQASLILGEDRVYRVNPKVPEGLFALDRYNPQELQAKAAYHSQHAVARIQERFLGHLAPEFTPFHSLKPGG